jgi:hypothetical protein
MKKFLPIILSVSLLLLLFLLVSCPSTGMENDYENDDLITFNAGNKLTRAIAYGSTMVDSFGVYGYKPPIYIIENGMYDINGDPVNEHYYWPYMGDGVPVSFVAYAPYKAQIIRTNNEIRFPINGVAITPETYNDVMYASATTTHIMQRVPLTFSHALAWIEVAGKYDSTTVDSVTITDIRFTPGIITQGDLKFDLINPDTSWVNMNTPVNVNILSDNASLSDTGYAVLTDAFIIPQAVPTKIALTMNISISGDNGKQTIDYKGRVVKKSIATISDFEAGKKYIFKYYVKGDSVDFSITTDDWITPDISAWESWGHSDGAYVERYYVKGLASDGSKFIYDAKGIDFGNGDYFEAKMDLRRMVRAKQNILSIGEDIANWSPSGSAEKFNLHIYFPNDVNDKRVRFSAVSNNRVGSNNRRTMGIVKTSVFDYDPDTNYILTIRFDKYGFYVNGQLITRDEFDPVEASKTPEWPRNPSGTYPDVYTYPYYFMPHFQGVLNLQFGSMEGSTRSYADYIYIMYHHNL